MIYNTGVVVGRFQVPELHEGHKRLISIATNSHTKCIVFIACTEVKGSDKDPLDYATRAAMIKYQFPSAIIRPIIDNPSDKIWSQMLDGEIIKEIGKGRVMLYSGKDGFYNYYTGRYKAKYIKEVDFYRGTEVREIQGKVIPTTKEGRCGVIYGVVNQYPRIYSVVDMAVLKNEEGLLSVLLGTKSNMGGFRFPGGFVDQADKSLESAAKREVYEECGGIETSDYEYICSGIVNDWRYVGRPEKILSTFFKCNYSWGDYHSAVKEANAEFQTLAFYPVDKTTLKSIAITHQPFFKELLKNIAKEKVTTNGIFDK